MAAALAPLIVDLAVIMAVAAAATILFNRLRQPVVLGYLLAGVVVGPHTPPFAFVSDIETITVLGEIGVIFLLFALGLEFNLRKLKQVGATALVSGTLQVVLMLWLGYTVGRAFGLAPLEAIFLGAIVSISSTVIIVKVVTARNEQDEEWAQIVFGILIMEDILAVIMLTLLAAAGGADALTPFGVGRLLGTLAAFLAGALVIGLVAIPRLVRFVAKLGIDEVLVVTSIALGFGLAVLGSFLGFSPALGAFLMGALIAESAAHKLVEERIAPIRDLFTAVFFVTVGMLVDPRALVQHWPLILATTAAVIGGKVVAGSFATFIGGRDPATALRVGFGLAQVGEFSFIIAALAATLAVGNAPLYAVSVSVAGITAFTTPYLIRSAPHASAFLAKRAPRPVLTYAKLYGAWTRRLRETSQANPARKTATRAGVIAVLLGITTLALLVGGALTLDRLGTPIAARLGRPGLALAAGWFALGVGLLPFALLYGRAQARFARALAEAALPAKLATSPHGKTIQKVLTRTFLFASVALGGAVLLLVASPFLPPGPVLAVVVASLGLVGYFLYRALRRVQERVDDALQAVFGEGGAADPRAEHALLGLLQETEDWGLDVKEVVMPPRPATQPLTLRSLDLRNRAGASIIAIHRAGEQILNPRPDDQLLPGDHVVLLGAPERLGSAERILLDAASAHLDVAPTPRPREIVLDARSRLVGLTLAQAQLREKTGATVIGIRRGPKRIRSPGPDVVLEEGDTLLVVATPDQLVLAQGLAQPSP